MHSSPTILALFRDADDESHWNPVLHGIPEMIRVLAGKSLFPVLANLHRLALDPALVIVSTRLYPEENPNLIGALRRLFPRSEYLLISPPGDPVPPLHPLISDRVRHLAINPASVPDGSRHGAASQLRLAVSRLLTRTPWQVADYLRKGAALHEFVLSSSRQKEEIIACVERLIEGESDDIEMLRQRGALLADEMLENAMYGAPRGADGGKLFRKGEERSVLPGERIVFRVGFDGETLAMEVADGWGSLSPSLLMEHLAGSRADEMPGDESGGRGLFIIWRFLDHFHVSITPGRETVVGGHIRVASPLDPESPRGFHILANS